MFRKRNQAHGSDSGHGGLIITPLLDLLVSLIPILIIGVVMTRINIVDVAVSKPVPALKKTTPNTFDLSLKVKAKEVELTLNGKVRAKVAQDDPKALETLHAEFVSIKRQFPQEFELKIEPENEIALNHIMEIIDSARELKACAPEHPVPGCDEQIIRKDEATGKDVRVKYLFPKIVLRGVYT